MTVNKFFSALPYIAIALVIAVIGIVGYGIYQWVTA